MTSYYSSASFAKMYDINDNVVRIVDLIKSPYIDGLKDPYLYSYYFLTQSKGIDYNLPAEGLNHSSVLDTLQRVLPESSRDELLYYSNAFLPQIHPVQSDINKIGSILTVIEEDTLYTNVYLHALPGEVKVEFYEPSSDTSDPYGILNSDNISLLHIPVELGDKDKMRLIVLGIDIRPSIWEYIDPVVDNTSRPYISLFQSDDLSLDLSNLPSSEYKKKLENTIYKIESNNFIIRDRIISSTPELLIKDSLDINTIEELSAPDPF